MSGNCYKVRLLLAHLGLAYDRREVDVIDRSGRVELLGGRNPALRIPTLILDDGRALAESNAILAYLAEETRYMPNERFARAQVLQWMFFEQYSHEPYIAVVIFWRNYALEKPPPQRIASRRRSGAEALAAMDAHLATREFLVGDAYTIADIALYAYTHIAPRGGFDLGGYPAIGGWLDRVAAQPGHVPMSA